MKNVILNWDDESAANRIPQDVAYLH
jgi:hypothetical protein